MIKYVGGASNSGTGSTYSVSLTSLTGGIDSAAREGDVVVVVVTHTVTSDQDMSVSGFTEVSDLFQTDTRHTNHYVGYKIMTATPDTSVTVPGSNDAARGGAAVVQVWRGVDLINPLDVAATTAQAASVNNADPAAITPVTPGAVILATGSGSTDSTPQAKTMPVGMDNPLTQNGTGSTASAIAGIASIYWTGGGSYNPGAWSGGETSTSDGYCSTTLALRPNVVDIPYYKAIGTGNGVANATNSPAWPTHVAGDIALLFVESQTTEATLDTANGFTKIGSTVNATGTRLDVFWARATSSSMAAPVIGARGDHSWAVIVTFGGCKATGDPFSANADTAKSSASTTSTSPSVTTTYDGQLIVMGFTKDLDSAAAFASAPTNTSLSHLVERADAGTTQGNGGGIAVVTGLKVTPGATGTTSHTVTSSTSALKTIALIGAGNWPTVVLNSPTDEAVISDSTPTLEFTGTDIDGPYTTETFTASTSWEAPAGITSVIVEAWGGGGGGKAADASSTGKGGGGGGAYSKKTIVVTPGNSYDVVVGTGGSGGTEGGTTNGQNGNDSYFIDNTTVLAKGGSGATTRTGAAGGLASSGVGDVKLSGGSGGDGVNSASGGGAGGGGGAGSFNGGGTGGNGSGLDGGIAGQGGTADGGNGGVGGSFPGSGTNGSVRGGGGGGSSSAGTGSQNGGDGARGEVRITYVNPSGDDDITYQIQIDAIEFPQHAFVTDDFNDNSINNNLLFNWGGAQVVEADQTIKISSLTSSGYYGFDVIKRDSLIGKSVSVQVVNTDNMNLTSWEIYPILLRADANNEVAWLIRNESGVVKINAFQLVGGSGSSIFNETYDSNTHKYFRIRESGGTTYWETSVNGKTWTTKHNASNPITLTNLLFVCFAGIWQNEGSTRTAILDNLNIFPATVDKLSSADAGFVNLDSGGDTDPFNNNQEIGFTVQDANELDNGTYYWRVRAKDPSGSGQWGAWSETREFTVAAGTDVTTNPAALSLSVSLNNPTILASKDLIFSANAQTLSLSLPQPTVTAIKNVSTSQNVQVISASLQSPTVSLSDSASTDVQSLNVTLNNPSITAVKNLSVNQNAQALSLSLQNPTIQADKNVSVNVNAQTITANAENLTVTLGDSVTPAPQQLTLVLNSPTVTADKNLIVTTNAQTITTVLNNPTVSASSDRTVPVNSQVLTVSAVSPSISAVKNVSVNLGVQTINATLNSPTLSINENLIQNAQLLTLTLNNPTITVVKNVIINLGVQALNSIANSPTITVGDGATPAPQALLITLNNPAVTAIKNVTISVNVQSLTTSLNNPEVTTVKNITVNPAVQELTSTPMSPSVLVGGNISLIVGTQIATLSLPQPTITAVKNIIVNTTPQLLTSSIQQPQITTSDQVNINVDALSLTASSQSVTISTETGVFVGVNTISLSLNLNNPTVSTVRNVIVVANVITLMANGLNVRFPELEVPFTPFVTRRNRSGLYQPKKEPLYEERRRLGLYKR